MKIKHTINNTNELSYHNNEGMIEKRLRIQIIIEVNELQKILLLNNLQFIRFL